MWAEGGRLQRLRVLACRGRGLEIGRCDERLRGGYRRAAHVWLGRRRGLEVCGGGCCLGVGHARVAEDVVEVLVADVVRLLVVRLRAHGRHGHLVVQRVALHVMAAVLVVMVCLVLDVDVAFAVAVDLNFMLCLLVLERVANFLHHGLVSVDNILALGARNGGCGAVKRVFLFGALEVGGQLVLVDPAVGSAEVCRFRDSVDSTLLHGEVGKMETPGDWVRGGRRHSW